MKHLVIEGWRTSPHSYALVNQHQLLHLLKDRRVRVSHTDVPFFRPHWTQLDGGFSTQAQATLAGVPHPGQAPVDVTYRITWPLRMYRSAAERTFVFGTCEFQRFEENSFCGPSGTDEGVDPEAVEIVTPSSWSRAGFLAAGFRPERVHVIPHGVDPETFRPGTAADRRNLRVALDIPEGAFVFLNVGALTWNKGMGPLLAAFATHRQSHPGAILVLKGGDALYGNLFQQALAEASRLDPAATDPTNLAALRYVPTNLPQTHIAALYRLSDAYVSPYRAEGFNLPTLEALASGIPVIVTAGGSTDDFCPPHLCPRVEATAMTQAKGHYLEPIPASLVECMRRVREDTELRASAALKGPRWVAERYSWARVTQHLADLLTS